MDDEGRMDHESVEDTMAHFMDQDSDGLHADGGRVGWGEPSDSMSQTDYLLMFA